LLAGLILCLTCLLLPVAYVETMCVGDAEPSAYAALIAPEHHRPETRTLMTYPEWHIVHAYEDYAKVIETGDPHDFGYLSSITGFWSSLCALTSASADHGEIDGPTRQMVHVIGVSFTAELLLKAAYEETLGRLFAALRGADRAPLDDVSAKQAADYAVFLQQVPWYKWQFRKDVADLKAKATGQLRDRERALALGLEYSAKAAYADVIASAVAQVGPDALRLRLILKDVNQTVLQEIDDLTVVAHRSEGIEVEAPRYRALTHILQHLALKGANFVEIAGNDDVMFTVLSNAAELDGSMHSRSRQGHHDHRHLVMTKVSALADRLRTLQSEGHRLEHIHDY
jgi:hypothetical protein